MKKKKKNKERKLKNMTEMRQLSTLLLLDFDLIERCGIELLIFGGTANEKR